MIQWLIQSTGSHPELADGQPPSGLLSKSERARLSRLTMPKRRRDWLLGRWTAKHLVQKFIQRQTGAHVPLEALTVDNDADGRPFARLETEIGVPLDGPYSLAPILSGDDGRLAVDLSISHCSDRAFCALHAPDLTRIGADIEHIESRSWEFVDQYFTDSEVEQMQRAPAAERDMLVTAVWSGKEAVLKALGMGLTVDTRAVSCATPLELTAQSDLAWIPFVISCDPALIEEARPTHGRAGGNGHAAGHKNGKAQPPRELTGLWRLMDNYVLSLVVW